MNAPPETSRATPGDPPISIRPLHTQAELRACVALQRETWGADFEEAVAPAILQVAQRIGGVAAGAFDPHDQLVGFVFGLTGVEGGRIVHWSDMLAVRPELRDSGLGRRLKAWQADAARAAGATLMYWTFDPLVARNAHLNFNRLGVRAREYVEDMYGESTSILHHGLGTDRLVVAWPLDRDPPPSRTPEGDGSVLPRELRDAPLLNAQPLPPAEPALTAVRIAIPMHIHALLARDPGAAARWRAETRPALKWALGSGFAITGFVRHAAEGVGHYLLERPGHAAIAAVVVTG